VRGIVTADLRGVDSYNALYLQSETSAGIDGASDGILVTLDGANSALAIGDLVDVTGIVGEAGNETQIAATATKLVTADVGVPEATDLVDAADPESLEGMLVTPVGDYTLASTADLDSTGSMQIADATGATLTIDDGYSGTPTSRPYLPADTLLGVGSLYTAPERPMVLGQVAHGYRLEPTVPVDASSDESYLPTFALDGFVLGEPPRMQEP
jgi:predicted extracellular nuclease